MTAKTSFVGLTSNRVAQVVLLLFHGNICLYLPKVIVVARGQKWRQQKPFSALFFLPPFRIHAVAPPTTEIPRKLEPQKQSTLLLIPFTFSLKTSHYSARKQILCEVVKCLTDIVTIRYCDSLLSVTVLVSNPMLRMVFYYC